MFLGFAKFYRQFIQRFSWIATPLTSMLKTAGPRKGRDGVGSDSRAGRGGGKIDGNGMDDVEVDSDECNNITFGKESSRSRSHMTTTNCNFTPFGLTSITVLGFSSFTPQSRRYRRVSGIIRDKEGEQRVMTKT